MTIAIRLCVDCVWVDANGHDPAEIDPGWSGFLPEWDGWGFVAVTERFGDYNEIREPHFSWKPCNGCGSGLGGDRYDYTAYKIVKERA